MVYVALQVLLCQALRDPDSEIREEMDNFLNKHQNQFQNKLETDGTVHELSLIHISEPTRLSLPSR
ncbi:hypothetical protein ACMZ47_10225, partial [Acinetobacter baumannii]